MLILPSSLPVRNPGAFQCMAESSRADVGAVLWKGWRRQSGCARPGVEWYWKADCLWAKPCFSLLVLLWYKPSSGTVVEWETGENCQMGYSVYLFASPTWVSFILGFALQGLMQTLFPRPPFPSYPQLPPRERSGDAWGWLSIHCLPAELGCLREGQCARAQESISTAPLS